MTISVDCDVVFTDMSEHILEHGEKWLSINQAI